MLALLSSAEKPSEKMQSIFKIFIFDKVHKMLCSYRFNVYRISPFKIERKKVDDL